MSGCLREAEYEQAESLSQPVLYADSKAVKQKHKQLRLHNWTVKDYNMLEGLGIAGQIPSILSLEI